MQKFPLSVRPVKKHKKPRYPGWQDPNPLDHPEAPPYPFSKKVLRFLAAAGFAGAAFSSCTDERNGHENGQNGIPADSLRNVFTFEKHGLPYQIPAFGSGGTLDLNRRYALSILEKLAGKEGFDMQKGHVFESGEFKIPLNGWDSMRRTGYVFLDGINSEDCFSSSFGIWLPTITICENDSDHPPRAFASWSDAWDFYGGRFPDNESNRSMHWDSYKPVPFKNKRFWAIDFPTLEDPAQQKLAFLKIMVPVELIDSEWNEKREEFIKQHVFPELEKLLKELSTSPDPQKQLEFYEDFEKAMWAIHATFQYQHMEKHWISAFSMTNRAERQQKIGQLVRLIFLTRRNEALKEPLEKAFADPQKDPLETFAVELEAFDRSTVSLAELRELDRLAASGEAFVMPVSSQDARFYYNSWNLLEDWGGPFSETDPPPALLDWLEFHQKRQAALPDSLRNEHKKWYEKDVLDALSELERQAQYYLRWAKSQGL